MSELQGGRAPAISVRGVGKSYDGVSVLRGISLEIRPGEVHGLLGENGAGKSTLLKILGGAIRADEGTVSFDGRPTRIATPRDAIAHGVSLISQELALIPGQSVLENVFLGRWGHRLGLRTSGADRRRVTDLMESTGFQLNPDQLAGSLSIGLQQQVEILKALARGTKVLAMDEPTAVLGEREKQHLLTLIRNLAASGTTVLLVSHFLQEVLSVADRVTVLRDGNLVVTEDSAEHDPTSLVRHMVGRSIEVLYPEPDPVPADAPVVFEAAHLSRPPVDDVSLCVRAGEIVGLAGLVGSGRSEILRLLFGADRMEVGAVTVAGSAQPRLTPRRAMSHGIALVPESRKEQGLVLNLSVQDNIALASLPARRRGPFVRLAQQRSAVKRVAAQVDIRSAGLSIPVSTLSGGNQQKTLFAKWLLAGPKVLLIDEPTRGVDVAAKAQIHQLIIDLARGGMAVVVVSSEFEEILSLSHRVLVVRAGRIVAEFDRGTSRETVVTAAFGD